MKAFLQKRICKKPPERVSSSTSSLLYFVTREWQSWRDERGMARRGRLRPVAAWPLSSGHLYCAPTLSLSLSLVLFLSLFHPPDESTAFPYIWRDPRYCHTSHHYRRNVQAIQFLLDSRHLRLTLKNSNSVSSRVLDLFLMHILLHYSLFSLLFLFLF